MLSIEQRNNAPIEITIKTKASRLIMVLSTEAAATEPTGTISRPKQITYNLCFRYNLSITKSSSAYVLTMRLTELFTQTTTLFTSSERYHDVRPAVNSSTIYRIVLGKILNILTFITFI